MEAMEKKKVLQLLLPYVESEVEAASFLSELGPAEVQCVGVYLESRRHSRKEVAI
ncbi:MAG: hypothetical protein OEV87_11595 [Phycisphaerae bacterium]|nr:hypothetical protein [Phycisphaerae bacterium]